MTPTALITGAARRIGKSIAWHLHQQGYNIVIHYHQSEHEAKALAAQCLAIRPYSAHVWQQSFDAKPRATDQAMANRQLQKAATQLCTQHPALSVVVHNAACFMPDPPPNNTHHDSVKQQLMHCNANVPDLLNKALHPTVQKNRGLIIHISDCQDAKQLPGYDTYRASKAKLNQLTQSQALAYAPDVRVNAIALGPMLTPEGQNNHACAQLNRLKHNPLQHRGQLQNIHQTIDFLIKAKHTTGQIIHLDGGLHLQQNSADDHLHTL